MERLQIAKEIKDITSREWTLDRYFKDIKKEKTITPQKEVDLAKKIKNWDQQALEKLVKANLRFVVSVAKQYQNQWLPLPDLINEGNYGLIKAAKKFDETRWFKFISYAVWRIRQSILAAIGQDAKTIRTPLHENNMVYKATKIIPRLEQENQRPPTHQEIAMALEVQEDIIQTSLDRDVRVFSYDAALLDDSEKSNLLDMLESTSFPSPDYELILQSCKDDIGRLFSKLSDKEKTVLQYYFWLDGLDAHTYEEIGERFGLTKERCRQIKTLAIKKIKKHHTNKTLKKYFREE